MDEGPRPGSPEDEPPADRRIAAHRAVAHRGGLGTRLRRLRPDPGLIDRLGGRAVLERVVDRLYRRIARDPLLQPLFGGRVHGDHVGQKQFFEEWAGGEPRYRRAGTGHGMFLLHYRFGIDRKLAGRWLQHMVESLREEEVPSGAVREMARVLGPMAHALRNPDGPPLPPELRRLGNTELAEALSRDPELFRRHVGEGRRLFFRAAEAGDGERLRLLAGAGVEVDRPFLRKSLMLTPWCAARAAGHEAAAEVLVELGAVRDVFSAAYLGDLELLHELLDADPTLVDVEDPAMDLRGIRPLHHAVGGGRPRAALLLLERGAVPGPDGFRLLRSAADARWPGVVRALLERGASAEDVGPGTWVLEPEVAEPLLARGADVNRPPGAWLHFCTSRFGQEDDPRLIRRLLELGADKDARDHQAGPLHLAAAAGHLGVLETLLDAGLDVDTRDGDGESPLAHVSWAVRAADRVATARLLLDRGADLELQGDAGISVRERLERIRSRDREELLALTGRYGKESTS